MAHNPLMGTWRLVSFELRTEDGEASYPFGPDAIGYIMYNEDGFMSVSFMSANRRKFASADIKAATAEERAAAAEGFLTYSGRYEIQGDKVIHHIEVSFFPNWVGTDLVRTFEVEGDKLLLRIPPFTIGGRVQTGRLVWRPA